MAGKRRLQIDIVGDARGLAGMFREAESGISRFGRAAVRGFGVAGALAGAALTKGFSDALASEDMEARIGGQLGVSPERAAELGEVASSLYRDAWGDSLGQVGDAVVAAEQSLGNLSPAGLESATGKALALADVFDTDVNAAINAAGELMNAGLATDADLAFDLLTAGFQEMPVAIRDELLEASNEYGTFFGQLGLSGEEAFGLLAAAGENGIYGIDKTGDALKELTIRATDMSTASVDAFAAAGLSAEEMAAGFLSGGDDARAALGETIDGLLGIEDPVEQANAAIALFGTPLEDLGTSEIPGFLASLQDMGDGLGDVSGSAEELVDSLGSTNSAKIEAFKRQALGGLADFAADHLIPAFERFAKWGQENWPQIRSEAEAAIRPIIATFQDVVAWVRTNWPQISAVISDVMDRIRERVTNIVDLVSAVWERFGDDILGFVMAVWPHVVTVISGAMNVIDGVIRAFAALLRGDWSALWSALGQIVSGAWEIIKGAIGAAIEAVKAIIGAGWDVVKTLTQDAAGAIVSTIAGIPNFIGALAGSFFSAAASLGTAIMDGIASGLSSAVGFVGDIANAVLNGIRSVVNTHVIDRINAIQISLPSILGGATIGLPDIPHLAAGGVVTGPTLALVGEGRESEAVLPLSRLDAMLANGGGQGGPMVVNLHVDGRLMGRAVAAASRRDGGYDFRLRAGG